jgi:hypothetical protein
MPEITNEECTCRGTSAVWDCNRCALGVRAGWVLYRFFRHMLGPILAPYYDGRQYSPMDAAPGGQYEEVR